MPSREQRRKMKRSGKYGRDRLSKIERDNADRADRLLAAGRAIGKSPQEIAKDLPDGMITAQFLNHVRQKAAPWLGAPAEAGEGKTE